MLNMIAPAPKASEVLQFAHDWLLYNKWIKGRLAVDASGRPTDPSFCTTCAACALGAIQVAAHSMHTSYGAASDKLRDAIGGSIARFNDQAHDKRAVLRKFRVAIRNAKRVGA